MNMPEAPAKPQDVQAGKKSSFGHFMREAEDVINAKDEFKAILKEANFEIPFDRQRAIRHAKNMLNDEVFILFGSERTKQVKDQISMMEQFDRDLELVGNSIRPNEIVVKQRVQLFTESADGFLRTFSQAQHEAKLGLQTVKERSDFDKLFAVLDVSKAFKNSFGVTISPEMLQLALGLVLRTMNKWDNVITIDAMPGTGKTTFDFALTTTMIDLYKMFFGVTVPFNVNENVFVTETREYCTKVISSAPRFSIFMFIEAGNQFNSKGTWNDDQQELVNTVERIRFHGLTMPLEWNTIDGLDKTVRDRRATLVVSIEERGRAMVRGFNRNPGKRGLTVNPRTKDALALTAADASNILQTDALKVLEVPYYSLPAEWEEKLDARKEEGSKYVSQKRRMQRYYAEFLCSIPENALRITSEQLYQFSIKSHQSLSMRKLAKMIADGTGQQATKIFTNNDMADPNNGFIELNEISLSYIKHTKAEMQGYIQYEKEHNDDNK